jgi:hypothetical protein
MELPLHNVRMRSYQLCIAAVFQLGQPILADQTDWKKKIVNQECASVTDRNIIINFFFTTKCNILAINVSI